MAPTSIGQMATSPSAQPVETLVELFRRGRPVDPDATLLTLEDGSVLTYADADRESGRIAELMVASGVTTGDRVALQIQKSPIAIWVYLACLRVGAVLLPMNPGYTAGEVSYLLEDATPRMVIADPDSPAAALAPGALMCDSNEVGSLFAALAHFKGDFED